MIVRLADVGSIGWIDDVPAHDLSEQPLAWSYVRNMIFRNGLAERASGYAASFDTTPTALGYGLFSVTQTDGDTILVSCGASKVLRYKASTEDDITGSVSWAATADTKVTGGVFNGYLILNESTIAPSFIAISELDDTSKNIAALTNWTSGMLAKTLRPFKYFLVAGYTTETNPYPYRVRWSSSSSGLPASWTATTSNDAGSVDLSAEDGAVVDFVPFGDQLAVFRESGIWLMRYIGGSDSANRLVMAFNRVPVGANGGMIGNNCGVEVAGLGIAALSNNDAYIFDGTRITSVLDRKLRRWLFDNISSTNRKRSFVLNNATDSEVWFCFPTGSDAACTKAVVWNYKDNTTGQRDLPNVTSGIHAEVAQQAGTTFTSVSGEWSAQALTWATLPTAPVSRKTVLASTANLIYVMGDGSSANGSTFTAELQRDYIALGDPQRVKFFRSVWPRFDAEGAQALEISIGTSMSVGESPTWQAAKTWTQGTSRKIDVNRAGRFLSLKIRSTTGTPWKLRSLDVDLQPQGMY